jgi:hypothetical protein
MSFSVRTQHAGLWSPLQRPLPGPFGERENTAAPCARQACHRVCRQGQASLRVERGRLWEHYFQPLGQRNPRHSTTSSYTDYTLRSPRSLPRTLKHLNNILRGGGVMWEPPTKQFYHKKCQSPRVLPSRQSTWSIAAPSCIGSRPASRQSIREGHSGAPSQ